MTDPTDEQFATAAFSHLDSVEASKTLQRRVAQIPIEHPRSASVLWPWARLWQGFAALGAFSALGVLVGTWAPRDSALLATAPASESAEWDLEPEPMKTGSTRASDGAPQVTAVDSQQAFADQEDPLELTYALALSEHWQGEDPEALWWDEGVEVAQ